MSSQVHETIAVVWRAESARITAGLARVVRDVGLAEELAQDALVAALEQWPGEGVPQNPGAWLMTTARRRAIDRVRRDKRFEHVHDELRQEHESKMRDRTPELDAALDDPVGDDLLRLIFTTCHPALSAEARVAMALKILGGLTTDEIARAFLVPEPTIAQRLVRAKRTLTEMQVPFEVPRGRELAQRLASVLEVIYLIFNEGYTATAGDDWMRPTLCDEARRLGGVLAGLMPDTPDVHGLVALMEIQASRSRARVASDGTPVLLLDQNRTLWDHAMIQRGLAALAKAESLDTSPGPYTLQAAIAACHARASTADATDWQRIAALYGQLSRLTPSPIIELNRAVAVSMAEGPASALPIIDALSKEPSLAKYHLLPSVRGDLLAKLGRHAEAQAEFERAAAMTQNERERTLLLRRAKESADA